MQNQIIYHYSNVHNLIRPIYEFMILASKERPSHGTITSIFKAINIFYNSIIELQKIHYYSHQSYGVDIVNHPFNFLFISREILDKAFEFFYLLKNKEISYELYNNIYISHPHTKNNECPFAKEEASLLKKISLLEKQILEFDFTLSQELIVSITNINYLILQRFYNYYRPKSYLFFYQQIELENHHVEFHVA